MVLGLGNMYSILLNIILKKKSVSMIRKYHNHTRNMKSGFEAIKERWKRAGERKSIENSKLYELGICDCK